MRRPTAAVLAGLLLLPQLASGQALPPGTRVRFSPPGEDARTGTVVAFTADNLEVRLPDRAEPALVPLDQVTRLDVSRGMRRQPLPRAGLGGGMLGLLSGAIPSEKWERVSLEPRRVSFVAPSTGNGQGVGLRIAF